MNIRETWDSLTSSINEQLKKNVYSDREAMFDHFKNSSQFTKEVDLEQQHITYDPFASYTTSQVGSGFTHNQTYGELVKRWREVSILPEVDEALGEICGEAVVYDEIDPVVDLNLDEIELSEAIKTKIRESFDHILYLLDFNERGDELFKQWYVDGTLTLECVYNNRKQKDGIQKLLLLPPFNIFKFKNEKTANIRWFINNNPSFNIIKDLENAEKTLLDEQITQISSGILSPDKKIYHSPLNKAMKSINQLYNLEDSLIIFRITRSPEKRVFKVDTGNLPKTKAEEYIRGLINKYRQKKIYNTETGTIENKSKSISVLEDFWFPINAAGRGTSVETLAGQSPNFGDFSDIEYFITKVYKALNVPSNRRNKEQRITVNSNIDIEKDEMRFFKFIQKLRRRFNNLFVDLLKKDLLAKQVMSLEDWKKIQEKIKFKYADSNEISLIKRMQVNQIKMDAANAALPLIDTGVLDVVYIQKNILRLTDEEISEIAQRRAEGGMGGAGGSADALGNMAGGSTGGEDVPGYEEVGGSGGTTPPTEEAPEAALAPEPKAPAKRFSQKQKESGLPQDILNNLRDGDIITNGVTKLLYEKGKFTKVA